MVMYISLFMLVITSTYGVICSMLIDTIAHFSRFMRKRSIQGGFYLAGGLLFPYLSEMSNDSELFMYLLLSAGAALLFFFLQTIRLDKRLVISVGILSLFVIVLVNCNFLFLIKDVLF
ncbi:hypothetical protein PCCS19_43680 [Paenibacillus sp. CCS19]|nr:hypothetical protein PCCS19_43680 [Paenibacillus cellulosilyticus]